MLMGLIELCLLSLISAQEPETQRIADIAHAAGPQTPATTTLTTQAQDPHKDLRVAEQAGASADGELLLTLTRCAHADVAARAAWLLGQTANAAHLSHLPAVVSSSPHPEARLQALHAIRTQADVTSTALTIAALDDEDRRVRTVAAQLLGELHRPAAIEPLLKLVNKSSKLKSNDPATDIQAALLALTDLGASQELLRMSTAIDDGNAVGVAESLTYAFQTLSPKTGVKAETTALVAILNHKELMLRRYAITRLTELKSTIAIAALESRLAQEGEQLKPLLEVSIAKIREAGIAPTSGFFNTAEAKSKALWARTTAWWNSLASAQRIVLGAVSFALILLAWLIRRAVLLRSREDDALATVALVQPSDHYLDEQDDELYEDEQYEEDEQYDPMEIEDESLEHDADEEPQIDYDTSGWEDQNEDNMLSNATPENETFR